MHAQTNIQAATSVLALSAIREAQLALASGFNLLRVLPHTSATALWTSGSHFGKTFENAAQATFTEPVEAFMGIRMYLNSVVNVGRRTENVSAASERGTRSSREDSI